MKVEYEEAIQAAAKYREDLNTCKSELKEVSEVVRQREHSLLTTEKEVEYAQVERDRAKADLVKASAALTEHEKVLDAAIRERNSLRIEVAGIGAQVTKAREEAIQQYKANFKDTDDYLELMRDAITEYKIVVKKVDPNFDGDYYENLILGEPQTLAPEDLVGFEQLDPIRAPGKAAEQNVETQVEPLKDAPVQPLANTSTDQPTSRPSKPAANQSAVPSIAKS